MYVFRVTELCESAVTLPKTVQWVQPGFGCFYRWRLNHFPGQPGSVLSHPSSLTVKKWVLIFRSWSSDSLPGFSLCMLSLLPSQNFTEKSLTLSSFEVQCLLLISSHTSLDLNVQWVLSQIYCLLIWPIYQFPYEELMGYNVKVLSWQVGNVYCSPFLTANLFSLLEKVIMLVKYNFPFVNPYILPVAFLFSMCLKSISNINCSMTLPRTEVRLNSL